MCEIYVYINIHTQTHIANISFVPSLFLFLKSQYLILFILFYWIFSSYFKHYPLPPPAPIPPSHSLVSIKVLPLPITLSTSVPWLMMMMFFPWGCKPFSSFSLFSNSFIRVPVFTPMVSCKHPHLYLYDSGRASEDTSISGSCQ